MFTTQDLEERGYNKFFERRKIETTIETPLNLGRKQETHPYKGTWQKCMRDQYGKKYFVNLELWDFSDSEFKYLIKDGPSYSASCQLTTSSGHNFNLELLKCGSLSIQEIEAWFELQWTTNGSNYCEKDETHG